MMGPVSDIIVSFGQLSSVCLNLRESAMVHSHHHDDFLDVEGFAGTFVPKLPFFVVF
jgi:hypothetical protein